VENLWKNLPSYPQSIYTLWKVGQVIHSFSTGGEYDQKLVAQGFSDQFPQFPQPLLLLD